MTVKNIGEQRRCVLFYDDRTGELIITITPPVSSEYVLHLSIKQIELFFISLLPSDMRTSFRHPYSNLLTSTYNYGKLKIDHYC